MNKRLRDKRKKALTKYKQQLIKNLLVKNTIYNVMLIDELKRRLKILS